MLTRYALVEMRVKRRRRSIRADSKFDSLLHELAHFASQGSDEPRQIYLRMISLISFALDNLFHRLAAWVAG